MSDADKQAGAASVNADPAHERFIDGFTGYRSFGGNLIKRKASAWRWACTVR